MTIVEFLQARLDEDEVVSRRASTISPAPWRVDVAAGAIPDAHGTEVAGRWRALPSLAGTVAPDHIARHDPARVLAEVDTKRRILDEWRRGDSDEMRATAYVIRLLALPYANHPDYDPAWRP